MATPRHSKFELSPSERLISNVSTDPAVFRSALTAVNIDRIDYIVQAYFRDRTPAVFEQTPMLWGAIRGWLTTRVNKQCGVSLFPWEWGLNGSASLGFSPAPKKFGAKFGAHSDLDFFVVSNDLYEKLAREGRLFSTSSYEDNRYKDARETVGKQLTRGLFLDTNQIPALEKFQINSVLLNEISIIVDKLGHEGYMVKRSFVRVYKSWHGLAIQLRLNISTLRTAITPMLDTH